jgi:hypothetical protein
MSDAAETSLLKLRPLEASAVKMFFESLKPLKEQFEAPDIAEIMINDFNNVWIEHRGRMHRFRQRTHSEMTSRNEVIFTPTVTLPSLDIEVEAYSRFSMRVLSLLLKFDRVMDNFDFLVWNGIRDQSDMDEETSRFLRKFHPVGLRGYMTHLRLMTTMRGR